MSHYRASNVMSDHPNNRPGYAAYINAQLGPDDHVHVPQGQHMGHHSGMTDLSAQLGNMSFHPGAGISQVTAANMAQPSLHPFAAHDQSVAYQPYHVPIHVGLHPDNGYPMHIPYSGPLAGLQPIAYSTQPMPYTPGRMPSYGDRSAEVPGLENRRGSYSTTDSAPATPFFGSASDRGHTSRIAVVRSAYNTPSPEQIMVPGVGPKVPLIIDDDIIQLLSQEPAIPQAVPAVFTSPQHAKSLEQCLENRISGNRNVYIRGLHPTTDDDLLLKYASRFGVVEQSKAIIDTSTGACKGFGFAKFQDVMDSIKCIKGFHHLGYEVGFARESFNARLKAEGDELSTNLYLSNLPKTLNETELNAIFVGYHVQSGKILRDSTGNSRGVGFARFETREECEEIIRKYHGMPIGTNGNLMQVRYADTPAQKELKRITAERRQFRTNEYNIGAYGTADVGMAPSIYNQWGRRSGVGSNGSYEQVQHMIPMAQNMTEGAGSNAGRVYKPSCSVSCRASSEDGSGEGASITIVDSPTIKDVSTQSSPTVKKEKP